jgi:hypothetical protein
LPALISSGWGNRVFRNWSVDSIAKLRSAKPVNVVYMIPTSFGVAYFRPDTLTRNAQRGFPFYQFDLALRRRFNFSEFVSIQLQADAFNVLNHPNFEDPVARDRVIGSVFAPGTFTPNATFGQSSALDGGPRALRFSVKLLF